MVYGFITKQLKFIYKSFKVLILNQKSVIQISCLDDQHDLYKVCKFGNCTVQNSVHCKV